MREEVFVKGHAASTLFSRSSQLSKYIYFDARIRTSIALNG